MPAVNVEYGFETRAVADLTTLLPRVNRTSDGVQTLTTSECWGQASTADNGCYKDVGERIVRQIGKGVLDDAQVVPQVGAEQARVTVSGKASQILPFLPIPRVSETVEGPVERFVQDTAP